MRRNGVNEAPIAYENRLVMWARRHEEARIMDAQIVEIALEVGAALPPAPSAPSATIPGDAWRLRGIPVVGVKGGVGGAIPGTKPHA